jgi:hypothetical protein
MCGVKNGTALRVGKECQLEGDICVLMSASIRNPCVLGQKQPTEKHSMQGALNNARQRFVLVFILEWAITMVCSLLWYLLNRIPCIIESG